MDPRRRFLFRPSAAQRAVQRPPGAVAEAVFERRCTRCDACIKACPPQVIRRGGGGFPEMQFAQAGCDACGACVSACEPGALQAPAVFEGWAARFGAACLAQRGVECRVCGEACDARAIRFPPRLGQVAQPVLTAEACTGCGACVGGCPTQAISMARG
ncbi:ferredoxin-type protein NapF [Inhella crocodyli]|uniref:Ferredoxin-type protein NapF n=1 Tax=Inhella crocodyli TaxID=2499851 RepID=A0A3S2WV51_9BURK|nr:ferredoxin-type protein NapF [Inhella crocodyli]RVT88735.1 ferredoxin-type protein NapF [Inhella crocodyli]